MLSKSTPRKPLVRQLLLFLDDTGVIRFGKRVHNAPVSKSTKLLLFPPPKDPFTELDISDTYVNQLYACASSTLNLVRLRYWISAGRQHVKKAINHCVTCKEEPAILISRLLLCTHRMYVVSFRFGLPLRMNGMHRTQFHHLRLDLLSLVILSRVF